MDGLAANLTAVHLIVWAVAGCFGLLTGAILAGRDVTMGNITLIFVVLIWSVFIGLLPIVHNMLLPEGLFGVFSGQGFAQFLEDVAPQAIFQEPVAHRIEVLISAAIGGVVFSACGFMLAVMLKGRSDG